MPIPTSSSSPITAANAKITPAPPAAHGWARLEWCDHDGQPLFAEYVPHPRPCDSAAAAAIRIRAAAGPRRTKRLFVIGTGPMGLALGSAAAGLCRRLDVEASVVVIGRDTFGRSTDGAVGVTRN